MVLASNSGLLLDIIYDCMHVSCHIWNVWSHLCDDSIVEGAIYVISVNRVCHAYC